MNKPLSFAVLMCLFSLALGAWEPLGPFGGNLRVLAVDPINNNILYTASASVPSKIFKSTDYGDTWCYISTIPNLIYCFTVDPNNPFILYAGSYACVYKSTDVGVSWTCDSVSGQQVYDIAVHPQSSSNIFATGISMGPGHFVETFFKSTDSGVNWATVPLNSYTGYSYCLTLDPANPDVIYIGGYYYDTTTNPSVYKSTDGGSTFIETSSGLPFSSQCVYSLAVHPTNSDFLYAGMYFGGIYRSTDAGVSWSQVYSDGRYFSSLATTPAAPNLVYAGTDTVIFKSTNSGASWFRTGTGYGGARKVFRCIEASPSSPSTVYTTDYLGFFKTTDSGTSWYGSNYCITLAEVRCLSVAPSSPSTVYMYVRGYGAFKSTNCGSNWSILSLPIGCGISSFTIHNTNPDIAFALEADA